MTIIQQHLSAVISSITDSVLWLLQQTSENKKSDHKDRSFKWFVSFSAGADLTRQLTQ
ncbi:hypothetical protein [Vibrio gallaecicus]|uniref:hypothetical protein n=1 Tax=Vibrio gallaecicus TaxID=552386 RepID=UPI000B2E9B6D|nr:hypothetical protein [Vibrio gallaecicus]MDN3614652.1 hypothetical protein [Vibrio gallaecicus]MDN3615917.1 hypothetical protein [Vibrio gallaecicus]MDN3615942.1 hypothetical protein [Vibrio gallaecicus]